MINFNNETKEFLAKVDQKYSAQHLMNGIANQIDMYVPEYINRCMVNVAQGAYNAYYGYNPTNQVTQEQMKPFIEQLQGKLNIQPQQIDVNMNVLKYNEESFDIPQHLLEEPKKKMIHYPSQVNDQQQKLINISFDIEIIKD